MKKMTAKQIGAIGEEIAKRYLMQSGFDLVEYGKEADKYHLPHRTHIPHLAYDWIGGSRANVGRMQFGGSSPWVANQWIAGDIPSWADLTDEEISSLVKVCRSASTCYMRDACPDMAPCSSTDNFFDKDRLGKLYPEGSYVFIHDDGMSEKHSAMHHLSECVGKFTEILECDVNGSIVNKSTFLRDSQLISSYINKMGVKHSNMNQPPYSVDDFSAKGVSEAEKLKMREVNIKFWDNMPNAMADGHPGHFDMIGMKDGRLIAIEVKTNDSHLSYWQSIRFKHLNEMGHETMLVRVSAKPEGIKEYIERKNDDGISISIELNPVVDFQIPVGYSWDDLAEILVNNNKDELDRFNDYLANM